MKKTVIGYGYKLSKESFKKVFSIYNLGFLNSKKEVLEEIRLDKKNKTIPKTAKPKIFKVFIEI